MAEQRVLRPVQLGLAKVAPVDLRRGPAWDQPAAAEDRLVVISAR